MDDDNEILSELEKRRQSRIIENMQLLGTTDVVESRTVMEMKQQEKRQSLKRQSIKRNETPPRRSIRTRSSIASYKESNLAEVNYESQEKEEEEEEEEYRKPPDDFSINQSILHDDAKPEDIIKRISQFVPAMFVAPNSAESLDGLFSTISKFRLTDSHVRKAVPNRIYSLALHPSADGVLVACGDTVGNLGLWLVGQEPLTLVPHTRAITSIKFSVSNPAHMLSSSMDGTLRCMDLVSGVFQEIFRTPGRDTDANYSSREPARITDFDWRSENLWLTSRSDGLVSQVDLRTRQVSHYSCSENHLRSISVHPTKNNFFVAADSSGQVCLFDLRRSGKSLQSLCSLPHGRSVTSAYFSPCSGSRLLVTALSDIIRVYDSTAIVNSTAAASLVKAWSPNMECLRSIPHNNQTGRWLSNFKATWIPGREDAFVVGSMDQPRRIEVYNAVSGEKKLILRDSDWLQSVCSLVNVHSSHRALVGGNSSGRLFIFQEPGAFDK